MSFSFQTASRIRYVFGVFMTLASFPSVVSAAAYLKIPDIDGESRHAGYAGWIELEGYTIGVASSVDKDLARQHPVTFGYALDKSSPYLMEAVAKGKRFAGDIQIDDVQPGNAIPLASYILRDAIFTRYRIAGDTGEPPTAKGEINYTYAEWYVRQIGEDGGVEETASTYFDVVLGTAGEVHSKPDILQPGNLQIVSGEAFKVDIVVTDLDTPHTELSTEVLFDPTAVSLEPIEWIAPDVLRISGTANTAFNGQSSVTLRVGDGSSTTSVAFSVFIDATGTPWQGWVEAYFSGEEQLDHLISGPLGDPDRDQLSNLLEFLLGTHPREVTPPEKQMSKGVFYASDPNANEPILRFSLQFNRRIDAPGIKLKLYGSIDGDHWTLLDPGANDNAPLYEETQVQGENQIYERVEGVVTPPAGGGQYFVRLLGNFGP